VHYFATQEEFFDSLDDIINGEMTVLVKASRGMKFEKTTDKLRGE
jgi:UDP-N-acetylmuramyl pentapeptide synthase